MTKYSSVTHINHMIGKIMWSESLSTDVSSSGTLFNRSRKVNLLVPQEENISYNDNRSGSG